MLDCNFKRSGVYIVFRTQSHPYCYIALGVGYFFTQLTVSGDTQSILSALPLVVEERKKDSQP